MNQKISRRTLIGGLAGIAVAGSLAACSTGPASQGTVDATKKKGAMDNYGAGTAFKATEPITLPILFSDHPNYPYKQDWLFNTELAKMSNVTLAVTTVPMSDYNQKRSLLVSAGDAPFIIPKTYPGQEQSFVASGAILPVSDYTEQMPNFTKFVKDFKLEPELETLRQSDGKFYVLPGMHEKLWPDYTLIFRTDLLEKNGIAEPQTWEEVYEALKKIKASGALPGEYVMSDRYKGQCLLNLIANSYGTVSGSTWGVADYVQFDEATDKFVVAATSPQFKSMLEFVRKLVAEKLLDPQSFTQLDDPAVAAFTTGKTAAICGNSQDPSAHRALMDKALGKGTYTIAKIIQPAGPAGKVVGGTRLENGLMITSKAKDSEHFAALLQFVDWLFYDNKAKEFTKWGVEGTTFKREGDKRVLMPEVTYQWMNPGAPKKLNADYGFSGGNYSYGGTTELVHSMFAPEEQEWQKRMAAERTQIPLPPAHPLTDVQREQATLLLTPLKDFIDTNTLKFVTGQRPLSEFDAFQAELKGKGLDQYTEIVNKAYTDYKAKK